MQFLTNLWKFKLTEKKKMLRVKIFQNQIKLYNVRLSKPTSVKTAPKHCMKKKSFIFVRHENTNFCEFLPYIMNCLHDNASLEMNHSNNWEFLKHRSHRFYSMSTVSSYTSVKKNHAVKMGTIRILNEQTFLMKFDWIFHHKVKRKRKKKKKKHNALQSKHKSNSIILS
mgnify:CR=1 FL=1